MNVATRFGKNLTHHRKRAGLSQEQLARRASLHRTQISLLERGRRVPRIDTLAKLAGALAVFPAELLDGIEWAPASSGRFWIAGDDADSGPAQAGRGSPTRSA